MVANQLKKLFDSYIELNIQVWENFEKLGETKAYPKECVLKEANTTARIIFIIMGFLAGLAEELVYRGYAISTLKSQGINNWFAVILVSIPFIFQHGLKSIDQFWWFLSWGIF